VPRIVHYGPVKNALLETGLNCEGRIDVLVEPVDREWLARTEMPFLGVVVLTCALQDQYDGLPRTGSVTTVRIRRSWHPARPGEGLELDEEPGPAATEVTAEVRAAWESGTAEMRDAWESGTPVSTRSGREIVLAEPVLPEPQLLMFGAGPIADDLARLARVLGYRTVISDPRENRFSPGESPADDLSPRWPDETLDYLETEGTPLLPARTFIVSLEHEPRFEDALWRALLARIERGAARPCYIGAIGKAQRAIERDQRAREAGLDLSLLAPIHTPIGLDTGGKRSSEVALSILAQIVASVHGRPGGPAGGASAALREVTFGSSDNSRHA
jgi:xanthine dehydrogenase accessory factor